MKNVSKRKIRFCRTAQRSRSGQVPPLDELTAIENIAPSDRSSLSLSKRFATIHRQTHIQHNRSNWKETTIAGRKGIRTDRRTDKQTNRQTYLVRCILLSAIKDCFSRFTFLCGYVCPSDVRVCVCWSFSCSCSCSSVLWALHIQWSWRECVATHSYLVQQVFFQVAAEPTADTMAIIISFRFFVNKLNCDTEKSLKPSVAIHSFARSESIF